MQKQTQINREEPLCVISSGATPIDFYNKGPMMVYVVPMYYTALPWQKDSSDIIDYPSYNQAIFLNISYQGGGGGGGGGLLQPPYELEK